MVVQAFFHEINIHQTFIVANIFQIVKVTDKYEVTNNGNKEINSFVHLIHEKEYLRLACISAAISKKDTRLKLSNIEDGKDSIKEGFVAYKVIISLF